MAHKASPKKKSKFFIKSSPNDQKPKRAAKTENYQQQTGYTRLYNWRQRRNNIKQEMFPDTEDHQHTSTQLQYSNNLNVDTSYSRVPYSAAYNAVATVPVTTIPYYDASYHNRFVQAYTPAQKWHWPPTTTVLSPVISVPVPQVTFINSPLVIPSVYPMLTTQHVLVPTTPVLSPMMHQGCMNMSPSLYPSPPKHKNDVYYTPSAQNINSVVDYYSENMDTSNQFDQTTSSDQNVLNNTVDTNDSLAKYFELPSDLFYNPMKYKAYDPNFLIDAFCSLDLRAQDVAWVLDLEVGHPRRSTARELAIYDCQSCMITCKNAPTVMHPGFSRCGSKLQDLLIYYYDSVISSWYIGFSNYYGDDSVRNFQAWLTPVMDVFGLCWCL
ncbi:unnamed protein product [Plutella xylostella]|uniref:(diamondback moth) hypothetical protein n=1 Tax=Plutella xylostella TaxID=51655 RepID=A0A8S4G296_PLUXY|nr:unnamed protein product [Plutella xylostella]